MRTLLVLALLAGSAAADVPADVAVYGPSGIQLGTTALFKGQVDTAVYDYGQDLIWFVSKGQLEVIDLRDAKKAVTVIAKNVPETQFAVRGLTTIDDATDYATVYPILTLDGKPHIDVGQGAHFGIFEDQDKAKTKQIKKIDIVGKKWIAAQQKRAAKALPKARANPPDVKLPKGAGDCEDETRCGKAEWLGETAYQVVTVRYACGDACGSACTIYDPAKKKFAADGKWGNDVETGLCDMATTADRYLLGDRVCTFASLQCTAFGGDWIGFAFVTGG